ncbi:hypothetical protein SASPL_127084 [Salvia splendens]|uniref:25S rRNA (uridine-N(3))-methyltransferase BMT5-like domain-containing protein n=1 Tax=Salvia splendens TaxID=180675 RepID=A0A8X8ZQL5_SALSN|nr:uncharacterized protein At4g26485-like isoform X1 [Salvia splendens]KAG6414362.1 hypothetical protein SASPL_127084 [Salvia splendens]
MGIIQSSSSRGNNEGEKTPRSIFFIYNALRLLWRKFCPVFGHAKPLLPLQNPASSTTAEPLLVAETPHISPPTSEFYDKGLKCDSDDLWQSERDGEDRVVVCVHQFSNSAVSVKENVSRNGIALTNNSSEEEEEDDVVVVVEKIKRAISVVLEERWIKHYSSGHRILLVGEGNFSFSACLALEFRSAPNIIATSLDSQAFLKKHYNKSIDNIEELKRRGSKVMHGINATTMAKHQLLGDLRFDRIVFNFPYVGLNTIKKLPRQSQLALHQELVRQFLENARQMIGENGEIHITHKTNSFHREWGLVSLGRGCGLRLKEATNFNLVDYPGYNTKCGFGGNGDFNCYPSKTYKFQL